MAVDPRTHPETAAPADEAARGRWGRHDALADDPVLGHRGRPDVAPAEPALGGWRSIVATAAGLNLIAGIWLIIAPFVLGYNNGDPYWNDIVFGAIVALIALIRLGGAYRAEWLSWVNALIGIWIFVSAFWLDSTMTAGWNDIILGAIVFVLGVIGATARGERAARPV